MNKDSIQREIFNKLMQEGAEEFGVDWLIIQVLATDAANFSGVDLTNSETRALLALVSRKFLRWHTREKKNEKD